MRPLLALAVVLALSAPALPDGALAVRRASVRFGAEGRGSLRIDGDLTLAGELAVPGFRLDLGPTTVLDGVPDGARVRVRPNGDWRVSSRGPAGGRVNLAVVPASGVFTLRARGLDLADLLGHGPTAVDCAVAAGGTSGADSLDFEARGRRWEYRRPRSPGHGPGPGDGGGGGGGSPFATLAQGEISGITGYRFEVVTDSAAWQSLWTAHAGAGTAPAVDFTNEMVVGIWLGERTSGGHRATIAAITPTQVLGVPCNPECPPAGVTVSVIESLPGGNCAVTGVLTHPHHVVRVPRETWGGALVEIATRVDDCF